MYIQKDTGNILMKIFHKHRYFNEHEITFFNLSLIQYGKRNIENGVVKYFSIFPKSLLYQFLDRIIALSGDEYDYYFIVRTAGIGEAYLLNFMYKNLKEKYGFKNACIVTHRAIYKDMYRQFLPDVPCFVTDGGIVPYNVYLTKRFIKYKNKTFQVIHSTLQESDKLFKNYVKGYDEPYPFEIRNMAGADKFVDNYPVFNEEDKSVVNLLDGFNINNFILFIPEANNVKPRSDYFWAKLGYELKKLGYDIFVNTCKGKCSYGYSKVITISQFLYLASLAKGIVSIRAGILEYVSLFNNPKHIIYGEHVWHPLSAGELMKTSTLLNYPMVDKNLIFEYKPDEKSDSEIIEEIMKGF